jgi:hypothetical protein
MVADGAVIDPGLTYDEAIALFGWTVGLAAMTGGAFVVGSYPGTREHAYPSPTHFSTPDHTSSHVMAPSSGGTRFGSGASPADIEPIDRLAAAGEHTSCRRHHGRIRSPSRERCGLSRQVSPSRICRDGLVPPRDHRRDCNHEASRGPAPSNAGFRRALAFLETVWKAAYPTGPAEEVDE